MHRPEMNPTNVEEDPRTCRNAYNLKEAGPKYIHNFYRKNKISLVSTNQVNKIQIII